MADAVVSTVAEQIATILKEQIQNEVNLVRGVENEIESLSKELQNVKNELEDAGRRQFAEQGVKAWLVRLEYAFYEMEDVLDEWQIALRKFQIQQQQQQSNCAPKNKVCSLISCLCFKKIAVRHDIATKIKNVKNKLYLILAEKDRYRLDTSTTTQPPLDRETISLVDLAEVHGRDIDRDVVASKIFVTASPGQVGIEERQLEIVSIVGVGGIGKTTLAQMVFNDSRVKDCFELSVWVCVSDQFEVVEIVKKIVECVTGSSPPISNQLQGLVENHLKPCILGKKFLLVLDDVWTEDQTKWKLLKTPINSCCGFGSKILVTTRKEKVAKTLDTLENGIHRLGVLSDESCWLLMQRIALFDKNDEECAKYKDIGMKIVGKCKGLPLAVKTLGSLLRCKINNSFEEWEKVLKSDIWKLEEAQVDIFPHLLLSYNELSPALKRCFSYCAVFPKDFEIEVRVVIQHWMALGYLVSDIGNGGSDMEQTGQQYFDNLAMRSLFQDFKKTGWGEDRNIIRSFKLHDIVHEFALFLRKNGTAVVEAGGTNKKTSCQVCSPSELVSQVKQYRILLCEYDEERLICGCLGSLKVLRLSAKTGIPQEIEKFIHLRWLDLSWYSDLPVRAMETICNELFNLQTLLLNGCELKEIPRGIGNLINLRHLNLNNNINLKNLPREIGNLNNLRHLDLIVDVVLTELPRKIENLKNLSLLRNLDLSVDVVLKELPREIGNLKNLRHLDLSNNQSLKELPREIGNLNNLRHLDLRYNKSLKELPSEFGNLVNLRFLNLKSNKSLEELPESICDMGELETLNISDCSMLSKLPQEIHRLVNLKHLRNIKTTSLRQFPQGITQLTCLRTLHEFRIGKDMSKLGWLKNLNRLRGTLNLVINLTGNMDVEDARDGELRNKKHLEELEIVFDQEFDIGVEDCVWVDVLDALQPHPNLQTLRIQHFHGSRLPGWIVSPLNKVKTISLCDFGHLTSILLPLGKLPCLKKIWIERIHEMRVVRREFLGITTETTIVFPKLKELTIKDCPNWEEWEDIAAREEDDEQVVSFMPCLSELSIVGCNSLTALPHRLLCKVALSLEKLDISGSKQLKQRHRDKEGLPWKSIFNINPRIWLVNLEYSS